LSRKSVTPFKLFVAGYQADLPVAASGVSGDLEVKHNMIYVVDLL
jgi:hypothetical protein